MRYILFSLIFALTLKAQTPNEPRISVTYNALETAAFFAGNFLADFKKKPIFIPLHFDINIKRNDFTSLSFAVIYRFESYKEQGPLYSKNNNIRPTKIWTNFNELFLLGGYRFSLKETGLSGYYISARAGMGFAISPEYSNISVLAQPEFGYSFCFNNPGFYMTFGLGLLMNLPITESHDFAVPWKAPKHYGLVQLLAHELIPILNLGLGFGF